MVGMGTGMTKGVHKRREKKSNECCRTSLAGKGRTCKKAHTYTERQWHLVSGLCSPQVIEATSFFNTFSHLSIFPKLLGMSQAPLSFTHHTFSEGAPAFQFPD